ncbi:tyrosine-protein kinase hopscotch [Trichogramma pretiosum]|uniref:tyrosine-protein kinase hopscotch n=1 Tax=Trichogramma pretiosum TaxID=7493 RepID=UPI0006C9A2B1|nr:tyrosine-protein kinase hopscotch [Trichogramma pretiosum]
MDNEKIAIVYVALDLKVINVAFSNGWTAEDLCIKICQQFGIGPVARHLFALRKHLNNNETAWMHASCKLDAQSKNKFDFRLRFKPANLQSLKEIDHRAYDYYFQQAKSDVLLSKVPDIVYEKHKKEIIGLGVTDMCRVMMEKDMSREAIIADYKKYIPKEYMKKHAFFVKKPVTAALNRIPQLNASYVKEQYLNQFQNMAPNYLREEFRAIMVRQGQSIIRVAIRVNASEITYSSMDAPTPDWTTLCAIEELCFISMRLNHTIEVSRKNGVPANLRFQSDSALRSFVSALDGYYRLTIKWTFNLCVDAITPSLERLNKLRCHGPIGGEFSYAKIDEKRSNRAGTFILRESETKYDTYYVDWCGQDGKTRTRKIEKIGPDDYALSDTYQRYKSIAEFIKLHKDPNKAPYLKECLPPSEYDKSPLLLICASMQNCGDLLADEGAIAELLDKRPAVISPQELQVYKSQPFAKSKESLERYKHSPGIGPFTILYKTMWRITKGKRIETVMKLLKDEESQFTPEFLKLAQKWGQLRSSALVRLYGVTLSPSVGMLLELVKLGPLDVYLRTNPPQSISISDLVEAAASLTTAVWHLEENGVIHGNIRCRKLMVHAHTNNSFIVKLVDPGIFVYKPSDVHWLPPECYSNPDTARRSTFADVWAIGTTMWEIFSRGSVLPPTRDIESVKKFYASGKRLPPPGDCPPEVYRLMKECWCEISEGTRKQPHAIMRDINQIKHQVYNVNRNHDYAVAYPKRLSNASTILAHEAEINQERVDSASTDGDSRNSSVYTTRTLLPWEDTSDSTASTIIAAPWGSSTFDADDLTAEDLDWWTRQHEVEETDTTLLGQMQSIFELDQDCTVILQGKIGQGFYGEVFLGIIEKDMHADPTQVALKKLKMNTLENDIKDFEREISIMKTLRHQNIVGIIGVISEPQVCLVMEYVKHGSLQSYLAIHRESLTEKILLNFALDIATGMKYLGSKNIVHRDLATRNVLVAEDNRLKISDFGLAQVTSGKSDYYILQTNRDLPIKWYAPESLIEGRFSPRTDVWSYGVTLFEIFSFGEDPLLPEFVSKDNKNSIDKSQCVFSTHNMELYKALQKGSRLPCPRTCPQEIYVKIMVPCWNFSSHERPCFKTLTKILKKIINPDAVDDADDSVNGDEEDQINLTNNNDKNQRR